MSGIRFLLIEQTYLRSGAPTQPDIAAELADWLIRVEQVVADEPRAKRIPFLTRLAEAALENSTGSEPSSALVLELVRGITLAIDLIGSDQHQARAALVLAAVRAFRALGDREPN